MKTSRDGLTPSAGSSLGQRRAIAWPLEYLLGLTIRLDGKARPSAPAESAQRRTERQAQAIKDPRSAPTSDVITFNRSVHEQPRAIRRHFRQSGDGFCSVRFVANRRVNGCQPRLDESGPGHEG